MMQCYEGEKITLRARSSDPVTQKIISDALCTAYLFNPSKDPENVPADRGSPDFVITLTFDSDSRYYLALNVDTLGYTPGVWTFQTVILGGAGGYDSWTYGQFEVLA